MDDIGRAYANQVWVLEVGRSPRGRDRARVRGRRRRAALGFLAFFGTHLLCNAADLLFRLGPLGRERGGESTGWTRSGRRHQRDPRPRAAGRGSRWRVVGSRRPRSELRTAARRGGAGGRRPVHRPVQASLAELALWQHRPAEAAEVIETGILGLAPHRMRSSSCMGARHPGVCRPGRYRPCATFDRRHQGGDRRRRRVSATASGNGSVIACRRRSPVRSELWTLLAEAEATRLEGVADPDAWAAAAQAWAGAGRPYPAAYARWREAEAAMALDGDRRRAAARSRSRSRRRPRSAPCPSSGRPRRSWRGRD